MNKIKEIYSICNGREKTNQSFLLNINLTAHSRFIAKIWFFDFLPQKHGLNISISYIMINNNFCQESMLYC